MQLTVTGSIRCRDCVLNIGINRLYEHRQVKAQKRASYKSNIWLGFLGSSAIQYLILYYLLFISLTLNDLKCKDVKFSSSNQATIQEFHNRDHWDLSS